MSIPAVYVQWLTVRTGVPVSKPPKTDAKQNLSTNAKSGSITEPESDGINLACLCFSNTDHSVEDDLISEPPQVGKGITSSGRVFSYHYPIVYPDNS